MLHKNDQQVADGLLDALKHNQKFQESRLGLKFTVETIRWIGDKQTVYLETSDDKGKEQVYYYMPVRADNLSFLYR